MKDTRNKDELLKKLVKGEVYWIMTEGRKYRYIGVCGKNNCLLRFEIVQSNPGLKTYQECFQVDDYVSNRMSILNKKEYAEYKARKLWEAIDKIILKERNI